LRRRELVSDRDVCFDAISDVVGRVNDEKPRKEESLCLEIRKTSANC
jgi:hypothetical protein